MKCKFVVNNSVCQTDAVLWKGSCRSDDEDDDDEEDETQTQVWGL